MYATRQDMHRRREQGAGSREQHAACSMQHAWEAYTLLPSVDVVQASSNLDCCWYPIRSGILLDMKSEGANGGTGKHILLIACP